jgi:hypothetical protein
MKRTTITGNYLNTICWSNDAIVDWTTGKSYSLDGVEKQIGKYHFIYKFDGAIISDDAQYAFVYQRLGTKGLLLKNGELIREINRSYYCANVYEYPAALTTIKDITYLIHCPLGYNRLDFENVETGELVTDIPGRNPSDVFYSRLEINTTNKFLINKGWFWHPLDVVQIFNINECLDNPLLLDEATLTPNVGVEICTASFVSESKILIGAAEEVIDEDNANLPAKTIAIWDIRLNQVTKSVKVNGEFGNLYAINDKFAWDTFRFPKIINIRTGEIADNDESVFSGEQNSSIIGGDPSKFPQIAFNRQTKQLAIMADEKIEVLTPSKSFL